MLSENIEFHRAAWAKVAKDNGWYADPFYVQIWLEADGVTVKDSVSVVGMTADIIIPFLPDECPDCGSEDIDFKVYEDGRCERREVFCCDCDWKIDSDGNYMVC